MLTIAEIRARAVEFSAEWRDETRESAEKQTFWNEWFEVFGIRRRRVAAFEHHVKKLSGSGEIDAFWPGRILVEHKSRGKDLGAAMTQAIDYLDGVTETDLPELVVVSDFERFVVRNLDSGDEFDFSLDEFPDQVEMFAFLAGYRRREVRAEDEVSIEAAELMGRVHDALATSGYSGHELRVLLVRLVFLLFADDSGVWEAGIFEELLEQRTDESGRDLGPTLAQLFQVLDTPEDQRQSTLDPALQAFPYVNGRLFAEQLPMAAFDKTTRQRLIEACRFNWSAISPAIFGSLFQSVMDSTERHQLGAHYTREQNILKALGPALLDELHEALEQAGTQRARLEALHKRLGEIRIFDPACGCGNFLIVAYRELRRLELEVLKRLRDLDKNSGQLSLDASSLSRVDVDQMFGIEVEEFPARIAEVAMYLVDHLANQELSREFGLYYTRLPLHSPAQIHVGNALALNWDEVVPAESCTLVVGNPPFVGKKNRTAEQAADMARVFNSDKNTNELDYVAAWFEIASRYINATDCRVAFVATNSICQGEQVPALWPRLFERGIEITFAHRTFAWSSEAKKAAVVHVVVIGFASQPPSGRRLLFDYERPRSDPHEIAASQINAYLADAPSVVVRSSRRIPDGIPTCVFGSMPIDGGNLLLSPDDRADLLTREPAAAPLIRDLIGAEGLLNNKQRYCLWLADADPALLRTLPLVRERVEATRAFRLDSKRAATRELAAMPGLFGEIRQPAEKYLCMPRHSSAARMIVPVAFFEPGQIAHDSTLTISGADEYLFGILQSQIWMSWLRAIGGRLKSDYRISVEVVYNTFPWPEPSAADRDRVASAAISVLQVRDQHAEASLADLYDPVTTPADLVRAHRDLDRAVDALYGRGEFDELKRLARLLDVYAERTGT